MLFHNFRRGLALFTGKDAHHRSKSVPTRYKVFSVRHWGVINRSFPRVVSSYSNRSSCSSLCLSSLSLPLPSSRKTPTSGCQSKIKPCSKGVVSSSKYNAPYAPPYPCIYRSRLLFPFIFRTPSQALKRLLSLSACSLAQITLAFPLRNGWAPSCITDRLIHNTMRHTCRHMRTLL